VIRGSINPESSRFHQCSVVCLASHALPLPLLIRHLSIANSTFGHATIPALTYEDIVSILAAKLKAMAPRDSNHITAVGGRGRAGWA
jgi:hypothetical protein